MVIFGPRTMSEPPLAAATNSISPAKSTDHRSPPGSSARRRCCGSSLRASRLPARSALCPSAPGLGVPKSGAVKASPVSRRISNAFGEGGRTFLERHLWSDRPGIVVGLEYPNAQIDAGKRLLHALHFKLFLAQFPGEACPPFDQCGDHMFLRHQEAARCQ
jgi:hypothetical protein